MTQAVRSFVALRPRDVLDIARAYGYLVRAGWRLFVARDKGQRWLQERIGEAGRPPVSEDDSWVERVARRTNTAARRPFPWARCLQRSMALCMWMEKRGLEPTLRIGVRKNENGIDAHSWLELNGRIVNDFEAIGTVFTAFQKQPGPNRSVDSSENVKTGDGA